MRISPRPYTYFFFFVSTLIFGLCSSTIQAQGNAQSWSLFYKPGPDKNGLTEVKVNLQTKVVNALGTIMLLYDAECSGNLEYQYKGRTFTFSGNDQPVRAVRPVNPDIQVVVEFPDRSTKTYTLGVISGMGGSVLGANSIALLLTAKSDEERKPGNYIVRSARVVDMGHENTSAVVSEIEEKLRREKQQVEIRTLTEEAMRVENAGNLTKAVQNWEKVRLIDPKEDRATRELDRLKKKMQSNKNQSDYDEMVRSARKAEEEKNLPLAERIYKQAAGLPVSNNNAAGEARRVRDQYDRQQQELVVKQKKQEEEAIRVQQDLIKKENADRLATDKRLKEITQEQENALRERNAEMARALDKADRERVQREFDARLKADAEERKRKEALEDQKDRQVYKKMVADDSLFARNKTGVYGWDPVRYDEWIRKANGYYQEHFSIRPYDALELKRAWWDYSPSSKVYADAWYEDQRQKNFQVYMRKLWEVNRKLNQSKGAYLEALKYTPSGSPQYRFVMSKITTLTGALNTNQVAIKYAPQGEANRIKYRDMNRSIQMANEMATDREKAAVAVRMYQSNAAYPSTGMYTEYELVQRTRIAREQAKSVETAQGLVQSAVISTMLDDSKQIKSDVRYGRVDLNVGFGLQSHPILMNVTYPGGTPTTETMSMTNLATSAGINVWLIRTNNLNAAIGSNLNLGLGASVGNISVYFDYGFKATCEVGFAPVKLVLSAERQKKMGTMGIDYDTYINTNTTGVSNSGKVYSGKFNYVNYRLGTGLKFNFDGTNDGSSLQFKLYGEKPDFYPFSLFQKPVLSFGAEFYDYIGDMSVSIIYGGNYVIPGQQSGPVGSNKNRSLFEVRLSKLWSL